MLWATSTVGAILGNPIYMGFPAYKKKTTTNATGSKKQPFENWILPKKKVESLAIIDEEMWYEAKKIREDRAKNLEFAKPRQTKSPLLLSGIVKCGECGYTFTTSESKKKKPLRKFRTGFFLLLAKSSLFYSSKSRIDLRLAIRRSYSSLQPTTILPNSRSPVPAGIR